MMDRLSSPQRKVEEVARAYRDCECVVFLKSAAPNFAQHFILNRPDWYTRKVFYANDPGPGKRSEWARILGKPNWVVVGYDPPALRASVLAVSAPALTNSL